MLLIVKDLCSPVEIGRMVEADMRGCKLAAVTPAFMLNGVVSIVCAFAGLLALTLL